MRSIFVFGSNLAGHHGKGAAWDASVHHGAQYGIGVGRTGNAYAIPTKDWDLKILPLGTIRRYVEQFIEYADLYYQLEKGGLIRPFQVTRIGCGLALYRDEVIAPLFENAPGNCQFDEKWEKWLPGRVYWGTYPECPPAPRGLGAASRSTGSTPSR